MHTDSYKQKSHKQNKGIMKRLKMSLAAWTLNRPSRIWKKMSGRLDRLSVPSTTDPLKFASDLNLFYNRFYSHDFLLSESLLAAGPLPVPGDIDISTVDVTNQFKKSKANKAPGPDGIPGRLLK